MPDVPVISAALKPLHHTIAQQFEHYKSFGNNILPINSFPESVTSFYFCTILFQIQNQSYGISR